MHPESNAPLTSVELFERFCAGEGGAADEVFHRYFARLTLLARSRLSPRLRSRTDPEDVVMSAWRSFFVGAQEGRIALQRSGDLWRVLLAITMHKLYHNVRHHTAEKRTVVRDQSADMALWTLAAQPKVEEVNALADELEACLRKLDAFDRRVLELRLQGAAIEDVASDVKCSERTVRRALGRIRTVLDAQLGRDR